MYRKLVGEISSLLNYIPGYEVLVVHYQVVSNVMHFRGSTENPHHIDTCCIEKTKTIVCKLKNSRNLSFATDTFVQNNNIKVTNFHNCLNFGVVVNKRYTLYTSCDVQRKDEQHDCHGSTYKKKQMAQRRRIVLMGSLVVGRCLKFHIHYTGKIE